MFGQRTFGTRQRPYTMADQLASGGGVGINRTAFGGGGGPVLLPAQGMNYENLGEMGRRQFTGYQAQSDRDLENSLLQQQLRNALQLQGMRGQNNLDLQGLVNSGALDQINARGGWDRTITGDTLSSQERRLAQQLGFDYADLQGRLGESAADRQARERMHGAGLNNALDLQSMQDQAAFERQKAALLGQQQLTGMEIGGRHALQSLVGQQQGQLQAQRGAQEMGQLKVRGQLSLDELRENARNTRANLMDQLGLQRELGLGNIENNRYLGQLNAYNQMYDTMQRGVLGQGALDNQRYATDVNADVAQAGQEQSGYQWANDHALRQQTAEEQAAHNAAMLKQRQHEYDNPQPAPVPPPPTRQALQHQAFQTAINALPDGSPDEILGLADQYMELMDNAAAGQGQARPRAVSRRSAASLLQTTPATEGYLDQSPSQLITQLGPILRGLQAGPNGELPSGWQRQLQDRGINPEVLALMGTYDPTQDQGGLGALPYVLGFGKQTTQRRVSARDQARILRELLLNSQ